MAAEPQQPDVKIDDPEELSQKKRINELLARRKTVIDARDEAFDAQLMGKASREEALAFYRSRIESLIIDLWTKFRSEDLETGTKYLEEELIDTIEVPPPAELLPEEGGNLGPGEKPPDPQYIEIRGLQWFLEQDGEIQVPFTARLNDPPGERTLYQEMEIPISTLDKALLTCIEFLDEAGIDADLVQKEQQTKIDRELLEEVDEWRREHVN